MEATSENALDRFIGKARELCGREPDLDQRWEALRPILAELLADPEIQEASNHWPSPGQVDGRGGNLIFYEDPDYGFVINGQVHDRPKSEPQSAHDHGQNYTAYGLLAGHERIVTFERTDDGSKPDYAEVRTTADYVAGPGDIHLAKPRDVHTEVSLGERTTAIIVRSMKDGGPTNPHGHYDLATNHYFERLGPRQVPAEMLPKKLDEAELPAR
jgi:predicted metal-dependent enzyme (double-stranded beta helix superfamily)